MAGTVGFSGASEPSFGALEHRRPGLAYSAHCQYPEGKTGCLSSFPAESPTGLPVTVCDQARLIRTPEGWAQIQVPSLKDPGDTAWED